MTRRCKSTRSRDGTRGGTLSGCVPGWKSRFCKPSQFPETECSLRSIACDLSEESEWVPKFVRKVYAANFLNDLDIAEPNVLLEPLSRVG